MLSHILPEKRRLATALLGVVLLGGCSGQAGPGRAEVHGKVLLDGELIPTGSITFNPTEGTVGPSAGGEIVEGKFHIPRSQGVTVGKNKVSIQCARKTGRRVPDNLDPHKQRDELEEAVPSEFNTNSKLVRDIAPGTNNIGFDLKSK